MRTSLLLALVLSVSFPGSATVVAGTDRLSYDIEAAADVENGTVRGRAVLTIPASVLASPTEVHLDPFSAGRDGEGQPRLHIHRILGAESGRALRWTKENELIRVSLPASVSPDGRVAIAVEYDVPLQESVRQRYGYYLFLGTSAGSLWYPDVVGPGGERPHFRDFGVTLGIPAGYTALTTGAPVGEPEEDGNRRRARYVAEHVEGFSLSFGEGYVLTEVREGENQIVAFSSPELADTFRQVAERAAEAVAWYRKTYGFFPVKRIGVLQGHPRWSGGFPLPNLFWIHRGNLSPDFLRWIVAHELGHYYWGLYVLGEQARLDWLQLANGIWVDQLYVAETLGRSLDQQWRSRGAGDWYVDYVRAMVGNHEQRLGLRLGGFGFDYNSLVQHGKAAVGVFLQARLLGTEKYLEVQRGLLADYRNKPLPLEEFVARLEAAGAEHAGEFFEAWQRGDATIGFDATVSKAKRTAEGWEYKIDVLRTGTVRYPVTVEARDVNGGAVQRTLGGREDKESISIILRAPLQRILLDPEGVLPMWNSSHPGIQRIFLRALSREGLGEPLIRLAYGYLDSYPEDEEAIYLLVSELVNAGRYPEVVSLLGGEEFDSCDGRYRCGAAIHLATALARLGSVEKSKEVLSAIQRGARGAGLERRWRAALDAIAQKSGN